MDFTLDDDGDRLYIQPEDWSLDKSPLRMNTKELAAAVARLLGCDPEWWPYYADWTCTCDSGQHACDQQCSVIADYPSDPYHARRVALFMEERGQSVPSAAATPRAICLAALQQQEK